MRIMLGAAAIGGLLLLALAGAVASDSSLSEEARLLRLDDQQRQMILTGDVERMHALAHPNLRINAPTNEVLDRNEFLRRLGARVIAFEAHKRFPEAVVITGNVGIVMGREAVMPTAASESGKIFGQQQLTRRYTNIYIRERGHWKFLARHANVVPTGAAPSPTK